MIVGAVTGCSGSMTANDDAASASSQAGESVSGAEQHEPLTIVTANVNYTPLIDALKEKYPEINIQAVSYRGGNSSGYLRRSIELGDIPDIYTTTYNDIDEDIVKNRLIDLSQYDFVNNYTDTMLSDVDVDGSIYLLPSRYSVYGIFYNKTMFEEHGWAVPTSFEELLSLSERIQSETDIQPMGAELTLAGHAFNWFFSISNTDFFGTPAGAKWKKDFLAGNTTAVGNLEESAEYFKRWVDAGFITDEDARVADVAQRFYDGEIAMIISMNTNFFTYKEQLGIDFELGVMPWLSEDGSSNMLTTQVSRYFGLNKELEETGNEQKLEDALKVMEFLATEEGQLALVNNDNTGVVFPTKNSEIDENSPLADVSDIIDSGYTVPIVYSGWVDYLLAPMSEELVRFISGEITTEELLERFDELNAEYQSNSDSGIYAVADERLTKEQAARITGMAYIDYLDADAALVSVGGIYDNCYENSRGANGPVYEGNITDETLNIFVPYSTKLVTVEMTGAEIKSLADGGRLFVIQPGSYKEKPNETEVVEFTLPYILIVKDDAELDDEAAYTVAFGYQDYNTDLAEEWGDRMTILDGETPSKAVKAWLQTQDGHINADSLNW
jgi:raffinose/stachyose/melibiose transport system substrate-binding protein